MTPEVIARLHKLQHLDKIGPTKWDAEQALFHLEATFDNALRVWPDIMERFLPVLEGLTGDDRMQAMRHALASTFVERFPQPEPRRVG